MNELHEGAQARGIAGSRMALICILLLAGSATAQAPSDAPLTIAEAVASAQKDYPAVRVSEEELNEAISKITLARTAYLPHGDSIVQINRATRNNVFGTLLPQSTIPTISGPVIGSNNSGTVWGSSVGALVSWQPFDFGLRHANVEAARAGQTKADAELRNSRLEAGLAAADAFLTILAAQETMKAANAAVDNWMEILHRVHALTSAELRPGADESRIEAELAVARNQVIYARMAEEMGKASLAKFVPQANSAGVVFASGALLASLPTDDETSPLNPAQHPLMQRQKAVVKQDAAQLHALERTWVPQFAIEGAASARGTGAETNGQRLPGANGLTPNVQNYAAGVNITFPFLDFASIHARESGQAAVLRADEAREQLMDRTLREQFEKSEATLRAAREIAENTPVEVKSAHIALDQARARYQAGLAAIDDLAQAQRLAVQVEVDDAIARLNVWRALLQLDAARGDLQPFLQAVQR